MKAIKRIAAAILAALTLSGSTVVAAPDGIPTYLLGRFSAFEREYSNATGDLLYGDTLYANWTGVDDPGTGWTVDLQTDYPDRAGLRLLVTMDLTCADPAIDPDSVWESFTVKLRSSDVVDKEDDPNLIVNGGGMETNHEHNYGWEFRPADVAMKDGHLELSVPLDRPCTTARGLMDWSDVRLIILTMRLKRDVVQEGLAPLMTMTLSDVLLVNDIMRITREEITALADEPLDESVRYRQDGVDAFEAARRAVYEAVADDTSSLERLRQAGENLRRARREMVEITATAADFSRLCGTYPEEGMQTLLADWVYADGATDGAGLDLSRHERSALALQLELTLTGPEDYNGVLNADGWALLRSADGDRNAFYGFSLAADTAVGELRQGVNRLTLPLDGGDYEILQSDPDLSETQGLFDWTAVNRLQVMLMPENYERGAFTMTVSRARVVDLTETRAALAALSALPAPEKDLAVYTEDSRQIYVAARQAADELLELGDFAAPQTVRDAVDGLSAALAGLREKPPRLPGDVDTDDTVTAADALLALQAATDQITLDEAQRIAADADADGTVTAADALMILQAATGKIVLT